MLYRRSDVRTFGRPDVRGTSADVRMSGRPDVGRDVRTSGRPGFALNVPGDAVKFHLLTLSHAVIVMLKSIAFGENVSSNKPLSSESECGHDKPSKPGRSTDAHQRIIDRIKRIIESIESKLTKNANFFILVFRRFFDRQASYRAETLTQDRSRAPRRGQKVDKSAKLSNRTNRST